MGVFNTTKYISTTLTDAGDAVTEVKSRLEAEGYRVITEKTADGYFISFSDTNLFKTISGLSTSLNVTISKLHDAVLVEAKAGIFGQQALPTAVSLLITWPVLITQVMGMIRQSKLDDKVIDMIETAIKNAEATEKNAFCHECGKPLEPGSNFCPLCGAGQ